MLKRILIVGSKGNMGRRYGAILTHLGVEWEGVDIGDVPTQHYDGVIIATPTDMHVDDVEFYAPDCPVLCEKPLSKDIGAVREICRRANKEAWRFRLVNQYEYFDNPLSTGPSGYDFYNHGRDSLPWDCINIIGLARGAVTLGEASPYWLCQINGQRLSLAMMDHAYVSMVSSWLDGDFDNVDYTLRAHEKVVAYIEESAQ